MTLRAPIVGWFHLGNEEAAKARAFLRLCNGEDSVDELGFGILRDGFAEQFFPGTSTIMTEARYLIFVAAIYRFVERTLERRKAAIPDPFRRSREMQDQLRDVLSATFNHKEGHGVIGISVKEPERYPSAIYWASLRTLGIFKLAGASEADYLRVLPRYHDLVRVDENNGDPVAEVGPPPVNWDRRFDLITSVLGVESKGRFPDGLSFELTEPEARYLRDCYLGEDHASPPASGIDKSLLAHLIEKRRKTAFEFPWDVNVPRHLDEAVDDARHFSALARGATLQYYHWLTDARRSEGWSAPDSDLRGWFETWWRLGRPQLLEWKEDEFLTRRDKDVRTVRNDATFLKTWLQECRAATSAPEFLADSGVRKLIVDRENVCKPKKARLTYKKHLENWKRVPRESASPYQLNFRAPIGSMFVQSIVRGLESPAVGGKARAS
jgi:hypothetical protein